MKISMIAAMADNRVIGIDNSLPWKLPNDMKWFRQHTLGKPIIMGRKTYESFGGRTLPDRLNIIITRDESYQVDGAVVAHSIEDAIAAAAEAYGDNCEVMIIGGASFYEQMLPRSERLYLTLVHAEVEGDAWFPEFDLNDWNETESIENPADEKNNYPHRFTILDRKAG